LKEGLTHVTEKRFGNGKGLLRGKGWSRENKNKLEKEEGGKKDRSRCAESHLQGRKTAHIWEEKGHDSCLAGKEANRGGN